MATSKTKLIRTCSIWRALELLGDKPTLLILEAYWFGSRRFAEFCSNTGLLKTVVSNRLQKLIAAECLVKERYSQSPIRYEYRSTEKLRTIYPIALSMLDWERKWSDDQNKLHVDLIHNNCGKVTAPRAVCQSCRQTIDARDVEWQEGPGIGQMQALYSRRRKSKSTPQTQAQTVLFDVLAGIIGDRWSMLIIRALFTGHSEFNEIHSDTQIATNILSERLSFLMEQNILRKDLSKGEQRPSYKLTTRGLDIYPILLTLMAWGDQWFADENGPPVLLKHRSCNHPLILEIACNVCDGEVSYSNIKFELH